MDGANRKAVRLIIRRSEVRVLPAHCLPWSGAFSAGTLGMVLPLCYPTYEESRESLPSAVFVPSHSLADPGIEAASVPSHGRERTRMPKRRAASSSRSSSISSVLGSGQSVAGGAGGADPVHHIADELIGEGSLTMLPGQAGGLGGLHVAPDGLAVDPGQAGDRPQPVSPDPQPEDLPDPCHGHLPERHAAPPALDDGRCVARDRAGSVEPRRRSHDWQGGGPMVVARTALEWSLDRGRRHSGSFRSRTVVPPPAS